jgi:hypothetical protein
MHFCPPYFPPDCWQGEEGERSPSFPPPCLWQGKGEEHFFLDPWYDGLKGEPTTSGRIRSTVIELKGQEDNFHCQTQRACNKRR